LPLRHLLAWLTEPTSSHLSTEVLKGPQHLSFKDLHRLQVIGKLSSCICLVFYFLLFYTMSMSLGSLIWWGATIPQQQVEPGGAVRSLPTQPFCGFILEVVKDCDVTTGASEILCSTTAWASELLSGDYRIQAKLLHSICFLEWIVVWWPSPSLTCHSAQAWGSGVLKANTEPQSCMGWKGPLESIFHPPVKQGERRGKRLAVLGRERVPRCVGCAKYCVQSITTRRLFVVLAPCSGEIRFCLCIRSSCKGEERS